MDENVRPEQRVSDEAPPSAQPVDEPRAATAAGPPPPPPPPPAGPQPPRRKSSPWPWILGCGGLALLGLVVLGIALAGILGASSSSAPFGEKIALVYLEGPIMSGSGGGGLFGGSTATSERAIQDLRSASEESGVRAIVLRIDSPGGSAAASQEIFQEVMRVRREGTPVIVSMGDLAASGGYYVASAGDRIFANNGTLTGSIGVIIQGTDMSELFDKIGLNPETIKSGKYKDMFSPSRPLTDEERQMARAMIMDIYNQFVEDVMKGREGSGLTRQQLDRVADGRVLTGRQALQSKLIDEIGTLEDAISYAGRKAGIQGRPTIWRVKRTFWEQFAEASQNVRPEVTINVTPDEAKSTGLLASPGAQ